MPRPPIERTVSGLPRITLFKPAGLPTRDLQHVQLGVDELEAIRLVDLEGLSHERAAEVMGVSRQTVGRVLERGRACVAEALVEGKAVEIGGGQYRVEPRRMYCRVCHARWTESGEEPSSVCPVCNSQDIGVAPDPDDGRGPRRGYRSTGQGSGGRRGGAAGQGRGGQGGGRGRGRGTGRGVS